MLSVHGFQVYAYVGQKSTVCQSFGSYVLLLLEAECAT